jgi:predicted DNA-binding protein
MRKTIYARTRAFRSTPLLDETLQSLSDSTSRHQSELIREAVWQFCSYYRDKPSELRKAI